LEKVGHRIDLLDYFLALYDNEIYSLLKTVVAVKRINPLREAVIKFEIALKDSFVVAVAPTELQVRWRAVRPTVNVNDIGRRRELWSRALDRTAR
jgi:hypothetical protein